MSRIQAKIAALADVDMLVELRREFLEKEIRKPGQEIEDSFYKRTKVYLEESIKRDEQVSCLAYLDGKIAGCGTLCYLHLIPTLDHPTGKRAHLMNIYVRKEFRRNGIGKEMLDVLISEAKKHGVTEISLDATDDGRKLYTRYGFCDNHEAMVMTVSQE